MTSLIGTASLAISLFAILIIHPFESDVAMAICSIGLSLIYSTTLCVACHIEDKLVKRIKALEDKLKDKGEDK